MNLYPWIKWLHILAVLIFFFSHGVTMAVAFNIAREKNPDRLRALMDASRWPLQPMSMSLLLVLILGVILTFNAGYAAHFWPWLALVLLLAMAIWMTMYGRASYSPIRKAIGQAYVTGFGKQNPPIAPVSMDEVQALTARINPRVLIYVGLAFTLVIVFLMVFKPF